MQIDEVFKTIEHVETEAASLYMQKKILKSTLTLIRHKGKEIRDALIDITENLFEREIIFEEISLELEILNNLMRAINNSNAKDARALTQEILSIITKGCSLDLFLDESAVPLPSLVTYHYKEGNELTFFLLFPRSDYLTTDRIGLVAHETSHVHEIVQKYTESINPEKRRIGESLADILGLYTAGPLFANSLSFVIINDFGINRMHESYWHHPSWIARVTVLHHVNAGLWETASIREAVHTLLAKVLRNSPQPRDDLFIAKCMRNHDRHKEEFSTFRLDERRIVRFKNEESDSLLCRLNAFYVR
ncbi:MAG: hypothetical protein HXS54_06840 [Theionarchaea archaeon]|nr:hypothetical protein [Theionarchaea archaeon]